MEQTRKLNGCAKKARLRKRMSGQSPEKVETNSLVESSARIASYAGVLAFSGLAHLAVIDGYRHKDEIMQEMHETIARAKNVALDTRDALVIPYHKATNPVLFRTIERDVKYAVEHKDTIRVNIRSVLGYEEHFVEGIPLNEIEKGQEKYDALVLRYQLLRTKGWEIEDILDEMLKERGEYEEDQTSMFRLLAQGKGNCQARAKLFSSLIQDVFPEYDTSNWVRVEVYRGYIDELNEEHDGHVRVVLEFADKKYWTVVEGNKISKQPQVTDDIPRPSAQEVFVDGSARALQVLPEESRFGFLNQPSEGEGDLLTVPRHVNPGIIYPESSVPWLGTADEAEPWIPRGNETSIDSSGKWNAGIPPPSIKIEPPQTLIKQIRKDQAYGAAVSRAEASIAQYANQGVRIDSFEQPWLSESAAERLAVIVPLSASQDARLAAEKARADMLSENPKHRLWIFYEVTNEQEVVTPLTDPNASYLFSSYPTTEQFKNAGSIYVPDVETFQRDPRWKKLDNEYPGLSNVTVFRAVALSDTFDTNNLPSFRALIDVPDDHSTITFPPGMFMLRNPQSLEGKTVKFSEYIGVYLNGRLPNIHLDNHTFVELHGQPIVWGEGVSMKSDSRSFRLYLVTMDLSFERRAFSAVETATPSDRGTPCVLIAVEINDPSFNLHLDPEMFVDTPKDKHYVDFDFSYRTLDLDNGERENINKRILEQFSSVQIPEGWRMETSIDDSDGLRLSVILWNEAISFNKAK